MHTISVRNVGYALEAGTRHLRLHGVRRDSRNGPVLVAPTPVTTCYRRPQERVLLCPHRDANPFFHLVEALWMLAGRDDLGVLTPIVSRMRGFSDDGGKTQPGAYGKRWRGWFTDKNEETIDQLRWAVKRLRADANDRRVVVQMWDANVDPMRADEGGRDVPCNLVLAPWIDSGGELTMTIFCRSNDIVWGAYGANAVHFSMLQEYLAHGVGVPLGRMWQVSNNFHAYLETIDKVPDECRRCDSGTDEYSTGMVSPTPLFQSWETLQHFDEDLTLFFDAPGTVGLRTAFLRQVAAPVLLSHMAYRKKQDSSRFETAREVVEQCRASDWRQACEGWLQRRQDEAVRAVDDGVAS